MNEVEVRFNPPLKKDEFLDWMNENLPMQEPSPSTGSTEEGKR